jgi:hypothetical protein
VGPDRNTHLRNAAILIVLALIVWLLPGGGTASTTISSVIWIIFLGGLLFLGYRVYMENRETIFGLEDRQRGILYASLALATITIVATGRMWESGGGAMVWLALLALAVAGLYSVWQRHRAY